MWSDSREKKMLAQRSRPNSDWQSYEDYKKRQDEESYLGTGISGNTLDTIGKGVSKTGQVLKDLWYEISTPRWKKEEERKKKNASQK
jgi:hypothetical protein